MDVNTIPETWLWIAFAVSVAIGLFILFVLAVVLEMAKEAIEFFKRANAEERAKDADRGISPTAWDR